MMKNKTSETQEKKISRRDVLFIGILFILLLLVAVIFYAGSGEAGAKVEVTVDGTRYGTYSLEENQEIPIIEDGVTTNVLVIENGMADMTEADCPDKLCVHQKSIEKTNETIVCLPNKVVVQVIGAKESELDSVAK